MRYSAPVKVTDMKLSKQEIDDLKEAVNIHANKYHRYSLDLAQKTYRKRDGSIPTKDFIDEAFKKADRLDALYARLSGT